MPNPSLRPEKRTTRNLSGLASFQAHANYGGFTEFRDFANFADSLARAPRAQLKSYFPLVASALENTAILNGKSQIPTSGGIPFCSGCVSKRGWHDSSNGLFVSEWKRAHALIH